MTTIPTLDDDRALILLARIGMAHITGRSLPIPHERDLFPILAATFGSPAPTTTDYSIADLARTALALAAEEPADLATIERALEEPDRPAEPLPTLITMVGALGILFTEISFEHTPAGAWNVKLHKRPASDPLLNDLAHGIMRTLDGAGWGARPT